MGHTIRYEHRQGHMPQIRVEHPEGRVPFIPQSSYAFSGRACVDMCRGINDAVRAAFSALADLDPGISPDAHEYAQPCAADLMDRLLRHAGFEPVGMHEAE